MAEFIPRSSLYHVRLVDPCRETSSGILLPESAWRVTTEAEVLAVGPGLLIPGQDEPPVMQALLGERVLFMAHALKPLSAEEGVLADEDLVAIRTEEGDVLPVNDWVKIRPVPRERITRGGIELPDMAKKRERAGMIEAVGPGKLLERGPFAGIRKTSRQLMGGIDPDEPLRGRTAWWDANALYLTLMSEEGVACVMVKAEDVCCLDGD